MTGSLARRREPAAAPAPAQRWSREWWYFALIVIAWCFTPLVRRLIDYRAGAFNPVQITSLIPFALLMPLVFVCFRSERLARLAPLLRWCAFAWLAMFAYGFVVAAFQGSVGAAAFEFIEYLVPMLGGLWLAGQEIPIDESLRRVSRIILPAAGIVALYGLVQWVQPPPWDALWVQGSEFVSVGSPVPFAMRVFATLNSPGTAGDFFALTTVLALPLLRVRAMHVWALVAALGAALLLTLVREAWVALIVGTIVYLIVSPKRIAALPSLGLFAVLLAFLVSALPAMMGSGPNADVIVSRISTFGDVDHDGSALDRKSEVSEAVTQSFNNPLGTGLGTVGAAAKLAANAQSAAIGTALDSGYFARLVELGWIGALAYMGVVVVAPIVLGVMLLRAGRSLAMPVRVAAATSIAVCAALAWGDAASDAHLGLDGFFFWIALGLGSRALYVAPAPLRSPARAIRLMQIRS